MAVHEAARQRERLYRMEPLEIAGGWVSGYDPLPLPFPLPLPSRPAPDSDPAANPRRVLDQIILRHLTRSPCLVAFSGGRDSSVLLAAAVAVARREGLPLPVPITLSYPHARDTDEADWQRQVLEHLGLTERIVLVVGDEHDPVGPIATALLARHGLLWPPNFAPTWRMLDAARGGVLLTGEGGDEVFGVKRITPLTKLLARRGRVHPLVYRDVARALAPGWVRRREAVRHRYRRPWLRPAVEAELARREAADEVAYALHAGRHAWQFAVRRAARRGYETVRALGAEIGTGYVQMYVEPDLVAAVAAAAGFWGWTGRTATMRHLFDDLLPRAVLERGSKAIFTDAVFTGHTRAFARQWDGSGVDPELVDPRALRDNWLSASPHAPSMALLQQAWLAAAQPGASRSSGAPRPRRASRIA